VTISPPLSLDREEIALLDRLRTIALLLGAAAAGDPVLGSINIALTTNDEGRLHFVHTGTRDVLCLLATAGRWPDLLLRGGESVDELIRLYDAIFERVADAELPAGCPPGLAGLLQPLRDFTPIPDGLHTALAQTGWEINLFGFIRPVLSDPVSAHEALEALVGLEGVGGLGAGPLGVLARNAVPLLFAGPHP